MKTNIFLNNFPGKSPRPQQLEALDKIFNNFHFHKKKIIIARMPTGSGKSHIATAIARSSNIIDENRKNLLDNYTATAQDKNGNYIHEQTFNKLPPFGGAILTVTRSLQDQYVELFPEQINAKGKNNYNCDLDKNVTVDFAPCIFSPKIKSSCFESDRCPYYKARKNALISSDPILNYRAFLHLPEFLQRRQYLILDEADKLEAELVGQYSITINYGFLQSEDVSFKKLLSDDSSESVIWLNEIYLQLKNAVTDLKQKVSLLANKQNKFEGILFKQMQRLGKLSTHLCNISDVLSNWTSCEYLVEHKDSKGVTFVPFNIKPLAQKLFSRAQHILLMSATISNPSKYAISLGIADKDYEFVDIKSSFDSKKAPIYCSTKYNLSFKNLNENLPKIIDMALQICNSHVGQKGLIHTHTNLITDLFKKRAGSNSRFLFREVGVSNEDIINTHKTVKEDTILVSPSLDTGISLDDDLGRFQIIIKAPYMPLGSKRIKKLFDKDPDYYNMKMLDSLIQMCGRCIRSKDDYAVTYILDGSAVKSIMSNKSHLPKYFLDRFM